MARAYEVHFTDTNTDNTTIGYLKADGTTPIRNRIYDVIIGSRATPADNACGYEFQRFTAENATPGGTAITARALDPADAAASAGGREAPTGEPTYTANAFVLYIPLNMRPTFRWVAVSESRALVTPATANNGIGIVADTPTTAFAAHAMLHFEE